MNLITRSRHSERGFAVIVTLEDNAINNHLYEDNELVYTSAEVPAYLNREHVTGRPAGQKQSRLAGTPGELTQGDLLRTLGPLLTVRGDTFTIRSYGESPDKINLSQHLASRNSIKSLVSCDP